MVTAPEFATYPELRAHFDAVYDLIVAQDGPRGASPILDVGAGNGSALAAVVAGTDAWGLALDRRVPAEWKGPPNFELLLGDAARLPFPDQALPVVISLEALEWFANPLAAVREMARVAAGRLILVHSDWQSLWFDSGDPETAREFTRLFAGPLPDGKGMRVWMEDLVEAAGLTVIEHQTHVIKGEQLGPHTYARHLLGLLRDWLCTQMGAVRARRFDDWRAELFEREAAGSFGFSLDRHVLLLRPR